MIKASGLPAAVDGLPPYARLSADQRASLLTAALQHDDWEEQRVKAAFKNLRGNSLAAARRATPEEAGGAPARESDTGMLAKVSRRAPCRPPPPNPGAAAPVDAKDRARAEGRPGPVCVHCVGRRV